MASYLNSMGLFYPWMCCIVFVVYFHLWMMLFQGQALAKINIGDVLDSDGNWTGALDAFEESYRYLSILWFFWWTFILWRIEKLRSNCIDGFLISFNFGERSSFHVGHICHNLRKN
jgi:hypothetical protein